jgi:ribosomal protein S18 acetylase RimI-like enzyme
MTTLRTTRPTETVRKATAAQATKIGDTLTRAFFDDPIMRWAMPDDDRRRRALPPFFELFATTIQRHDEVYLAGDGIGAALWVPPDRQVVDEDDAEEFGRRMEAIAGVDAARSFEISALLDEHHPHGSFYFLQLLGVEPEAQGQGLGSTLLRTVLERCDREGTGAYLDATSPPNRRLYERHGFVAIGELAPAGGPQLWQMWRDPATR